MFKYFIYITFAVFFIKPAMAQNLDIDADFVGSYCTEYFGLVSVSFENTSGKWITVKSINTSFGSDEVDKNVTIISGDRLKSWDDAIQSKLRNDAFYSQLLLGAFAVLGASSENKSVRNIGLGTASVLTVSELTKLKDRINLGKAVPGSHLLSGGFSVPPGMSVSKWALFGTESNTNTPYLDKFVVNGYLESGEKINASINLRGEDGGDGGCIWQSKLRPVL